MKQLPCCPSCSRAAFRPNRIQQRDLDWQTIVVVIRDATVMLARM
jgi:hypothetical protein